MKTGTNSNNCKRNRSAATRAAGRVGFLAFVACILILAGGALWYWRSKQPRTMATFAATVPSGVLSEATSQILAGIDSPIDLRLYAPADVSAMPAALGGYLSRVNGLLAEYESAAAGKVRVSKRDPQTDKAAKSAAGGAGIVPFASENGEIVYLGLTVGNGARVETVAPLAPEWEAALESDISRAIRRVTASVAAPARPGAPTPAAATPIDPAISEELLQTFPDLASRTFEEAAQVLRERAFEQFKAAAMEMQAKVQLAQQNLATARQSKSAAEQAAALKAFQEIQAEQANKLKVIAARLQERIVVLQRLKETSAPPAPPQSP